MFDSLVWRGAIHGKIPCSPPDYKNLEEFYPCEVIEATGNYLLVAPIFFRPVWVVSNLVQIAEENYYELIEGENEKTNT